MTASEHLHLPEREWPCKACGEPFCRHIPGSMGSQCPVPGPIQLTPGFHPFARQPDRTPAADPREYVCARQECGRPYFEHRLGAALMDCPDGSGACSTFVAPEGDRVSEFRIRELIAEVGLE